MTDLPSKPHRGRLLDARLHLLDRQLLNVDDEPMGIVDDLELTDFELDNDIPTGTEAPRVTGLLAGQVVATRNLGRRTAPVTAARDSMGSGRLHRHGGETQADRHDP
jgi:hypothetical protein